MKVRRDGSFEVTAVGTLAFISMSIKIVGQPNAAGRTGPGRTGPAERGLAERGRPNGAERGRPNGAWPNRAGRTEPAERGRPNGAGPVGALAERGLSPGEGTRFPSSYPSIKLFHFF